MSAIRFVRTWRDDLDAEEVVPEIDGRLLTEMVSGRGGLIPAFFRFAPAADHFAPKDAEVPVLGCECGEWGCHPLLTRITSDGWIVTWSDMAPGLGPFTFDAEEYASAIRELEPHWRTPT